MTLWFSKCNVWSHACDDVVKRWTGVTEVLQLASPEVSVQTSDDCAMLIRLRSVSGCAHDHETLCDLVHQFMMRL